VAIEVGKEELKQKLHRVMRFS